MDKRAQGLASSKVAAIIIGILLLSFVGSFLIYQANPNWFYKFLPNLKPVGNGDDVEISGAVGAINPCSAKSLVMVGSILSGAEGNLFRVVIDEKFDRDLFWSESGGFEVEGENVGEVKNGRVLISAEYLDENNELFVKNLFSSEPLVLTAKQLALLNGATLEGGYFCKGSASYEGYVPAWPEGTDVRTISAVMPFLFKDNNWIQAILYPDYFYSESNFYLEKFNQNGFTGIQQIRLYKNSKEGFSGYILVFYFDPKVNFGGCTAGAVNTKGEVFLGDFFGYNDWSSFDRTPFYGCKFNSNSFKDNDVLKYHEVIGEKEFYKTNLKLDVEKVL